MDVEDLAIFLAVVEQGSMSAAARGAHRSQPTVSRAVQRLERELGAALLRRTEAGVVEVLPAGSLVLDAARRIVGETRRLHDGLAGLSHGARGTLSIAASSIPGEYLAPIILAAFRQRFPGVGARVAVSDSAQVVAALLQRDADVGFVGAASTDDRLMQEPVGEDRIVLVVAADHPFARRTSIGFEELEGQALVLREEGSGTMATLTQTLANRGVALPVEHATVVGTTRAQLAAVRAGLGIGFLSSWAAAGADGVRVVPVDGLDARRTLYLVYEPQRLVAPAVQLFVEFVREWRRDRVAQAGAAGAREALP